MYTPPRILTNLTVKDSYVFSEEKKDPYYEHINTGSSMHSIMQKITKSMNESKVG
jgi:hypothetical protein